MSKNPSFSILNPSTWNTPTKVAFGAGLFVLCMANPVAAGAVVIAGAATTQHNPQHCDVAIATYCYNTKSLVGRWPNYIEDEYDPGLQTKHLDTTNLPGILSRVPVDNGCTVKLATEGGGCPGAKKAGFVKETANLNGDVIGFVNDVAEIGEPQLCVPIKTSYYAQAYRCLVADELDDSMPALAGDCDQS